MSGPLDQLAGPVATRISRLLAEEHRGASELLGVFVEDRIIAVSLRAASGNVELLRHTMRRRVHDAVQALVGRRIEGFLFDEVAEADVVLCVFVFAQPVEPADG